MSIAYTDFVVVVVVVSRNVPIHWIIIHTVDNISVFP